MIWETQKAICFLAESEGKVDLHSRRLSYLLVTEKVKKYFSRYILHGKQAGNIWFDYNGIPLKLHYPLEVLCDKMHPEEHSVARCLIIISSRENPIFGKQINNFDKNGKFQCTYKSVFGWSKMQGRVLMYVHIKIQCSFKLLFV